MRAATTLLAIAFASRTPFWSGDLFTFSLIDGTVFRFTSADQPITTRDPDTGAATTWQSVGPLIQRSNWSVKSDASNVAMQIKLYSTGADFAPGNLKRMIHDGYLDGATVALERVFMPAFGDTSLGSVLLFEGRVGAVSVTALGAEIACNAAIVALDQYIPKNTYQIGCIHTLYDSGCTLSRAAYTASFTVDSAGPGGINWQGAPVADGSVYPLGTLVVTSGAGAGQRRTIVNCAGNAVGIAYPFLVVPAHGDTFTLTQGCAKTTTRCQQFNNLQHFRGFPYIPPALYGI